MSDDEVNAVDYQITVLNKKCHSNIKDWPIVGEAYFSHLVGDDAQPWLYDCAVYPCKNLRQPCGGTDVSGDFLWFQLILRSDNGRII
jgi:hypothetical protein